MELIDRYLQSVKTALPHSQQADVISELSDEILSQVEDKQAALGRPLTEDEQVALLKQFGHPWLLAARYRKQQYLISPTVFPIYWITLKVVLLFVLLGMSVGAVAAALTGQGLGTAIGIVGRYPLAALYTAAWVTLVFVVLERLQLKFDFFGKWDPRTLPKLTNSETKNPYGQAVASLVFGTIFGVWWLVGLKNQFLIFGPGINFMHFGPVWQTVYPLFVVLVVADLVRHVLKVMRPQWEKAYAWSRLGFRLLNLLILFFLLGSNELLVASESSPQLQPAMKQLNSGLHFGLVVVTLIAVVHLALDVYRLVIRRTDRVPRVATCL